jgi:hypothetical protein
MLYGSYSFNQMKYTETKNIISTVSFNETHIINEQDIVSLPQSIQKWLRSSGAIGREEIKLTYVKQEALMKLKPEQTKWYSAQAIQYITTQKPAFIWTVEMNMMPLITIKGRDKSYEGKGEMLIKLNSLINIVNEDGVKIDEGALQRYLAEIVWSPSSAISPYIEWEEIDSLTTKAIINYKGTVASGSFYFNEKGDFVKFTTMRYKDNILKAKRYPWVITVQEYKTFEGIRVPSKTKVTWELDKKDWTWLNLEIKDIKYNNNAKKIFDNYFQTKK